MAQQPIGVMDYTLGWHISLATMSHHKASKSNVHSVTDLGKGFKPMTEIDVKLADLRCYRCA